MDSNYQVPNSGLLRFRSAPTSLLANFTQSLPSSDINKLNNPWDTSESDTLISGFVNNNNDTDSSSFQEFEAKAPKPPTEAVLNLMNSHQSYNQNNNNNGLQLPPHYPTHPSSTASSAMDCSYALPASLGMDLQTPSKTFASNLHRQNSSPAGLFSNISFPNGCTTMKSVGNYSLVNGSNGELSPSMSRLKSQFSFPSRSGSSLGMLSQISEIENESIGATSPDDGRLRSSNNGSYGPGFPYTSWNEDPMGLKRGQSNNEKLFSDSQNGQLGNRVHILSHHLSLPNPASDISAMDKFLRFPDSVPCKIRAKRGCATHPRSVAERVRRTRISERMRKLQELVPHMDKQTNTADMLDLAVNYIKDLQKQFKTLSEKRANCKCMQKTDTNHVV